MIIVNIMKNKNMDYYDFTLVRGDTADFQVVPEVINPDTGDSSSYQMQDGDYIEFNIRKDWSGDEPLISIRADKEQVVSITSEASDKLDVGDYFCDVTLYHADKVDTFIRLPYNTSTKQGINNFHVVYGV